MGEHSPAAVRQVLLVLRKPALTAPQNHVLRQTLLDAPTAPQTRSITGAGFDADRTSGPHSLMMRPRALQAKPNHPIPLAEVLHDRIHFVDGWLGKTSYRSGSVSCSPSNTFLRGGHICQK